MSTIGPTYPAHIIVSQAEVRLAADETSSANAATIKADQNQIEAAQEIEAAAAKAGIVFRYLTDTETAPTGGRRAGAARVELPAGVA